MAEVGLVRFAQAAREVAETVLPSYRSKYSKQLFTQPSLVAILCLLRYEDWTVREAEVRLGEHQDLRAALRLERVPDDTTLSRFGAAAGWGDRGAGGDRGGGATAAVTARARGQGRGGRCDRVIAQGCQPLLRRSHPQAGPGADAAALAEVGGRCRCSAARRAGPASLRRPRQRLGAVTSDRRPGTADREDEAGLSRCGSIDSARTHRHIRDHLGADSIIRGPARHVHLAAAGHSGADAGELPDRPLSPAHAGRKCLLRRQAQALLARSRSPARHPASPDAAPGPRL